VQQLVEQTLIRWMRFVHKQLLVHDVYAVNVNTHTARGDKMLACLVRPEARFMLSLFFLQQNKSGNQ
jgi:hypothetical protein